MCGPKVGRRLRALLLPCPWLEWHHMIYCVSSSVPTNVADIGRLEDATVALLSSTT